MSRPAHRGSSRLRKFLLFRRTTTHRASQRSTTGCISSISSCVSSPLLLLLARVSIPPRVFPSLTEVTLFAPNSGPFSPSRVLSRPPGLPLLPRRRRQHRLPHMVQIELPPRLLLRRLRFPSPGPQRPLLLLWPPLVGMGLLSFHSRPLRGKMCRHEQ
jgi:hypothetical protein